MAIKIKCSCGAMYEDTFKFCPECATPNPRMQAKKPKIQDESSEETPKAPSTRKKFTKVGESSLTSSTSEEIIKPKKKYIPEPEPEYEDEDEYEDSTEEYEEEPDYDDEYEDDSDYDDEDEEDSEYEDEDYEEESGYEEDDDEQDDDDEYEEPVVKVPTYKSKSKALGAPTSKSIKQTSSAPSKKPSSKKVSSTKSSLSKKQRKYDPNYDGYYDDRLPAILDEVTKTSHLDVILKIALAVICIAALIVYCIFYVQV